MKIFSNKYYLTAEFAMLFFGIPVFIMVVIHPIRLLLPVVILIFIYPVFSALLQEIVIPFLSFHAVCSLHQLCTEYMATWFSASGLAITSRLIYINTINSICSVPYQVSIAVLNTFKLLKMRIIVKIDGKFHEVIHLLSIQMRWFPFSGQIFNDSRKQFSQS